MRDILLIFPGKRNVKDVNMPIPLLYVAKPLVDNGYHPQIFDSRIKDYKELKLDNVLCVGITAMTGRQVEYALEVASYIREKNPKVPLIWGGPHPTSLPEQTARSQYVDIVVRHEGEETFLELVKKLASNEPIDSVDGITFEKDGKVISTPDRQLLDLNKIGNLPYHLLEMEHYPNIEDKFELLTSRGCPHRCGFCGNGVIYGRWRAKGPEVVINELEFIIKKFDPKRIVIIDGNFFVNRKRVEEICLLIKEKKWNLKLRAFIRCDYVVRYSKSFLNLLREAGFNELAFGGESGSDRMLKFINKDVEIKEIVETTRLFREHHILPTISFMMGLPDETPQELNQTLDLYDRIMSIYPKAQVNGVFIFAPAPGSPLARLVEKAYGYEPPHSLESWAKWRWTDFKRVSWVDGISKSVYQGIYLIARYFFVEKLISSWSYRQKLIRYGSPLWVLLSVIFNGLFSLPAHLRWKRRFFKFPIEWKLYRAVYLEVKGGD